jgi:hypothetical protein
MARVAQDRIARLEHALAELPDVAAVKKKSGAKDATRHRRRSPPDPCRGGEWIRGSQLTAG